MRVWVRVRIRVRVRVKFFLYIFNRITSFYTTANILLSYYVVVLT